MKYENLIEAVQIERQLDKVEKQIKEIELFNYLQVYGNLLRQYRDAETVLQNRHIELLGCEYNPPVAEFEADEDRIK